MNFLNNNFVFNICIVLFKYKENYRKDKKYPCKNYYIIDTILVINKKYPLHFISHVIYNNNNNKQLVGKLFKFFI